ncbi:MAG: energy transducer TonB [Pseudomonadota bacterium]
MTFSALKWPIALTVSLAVHFGLGILFKSDSDKILIDGGASVEVASFGGAFSDSIASGSPDEILEPTEPTLDELVSETQTSDILEPIEEIVDDNSKVEELDVQQPIVSELANEIQPSVLETAPSEASTQPADKPVEVASKPIEAITEPLEAELQSSLQPLLETVPVPKKREVFKTKPKKKTKKAAEKPAKKKKRKPPPKKKVASGDKGKQKVSAKSGSKDGNKKAKAKTTGKKQRSAKLSGNAAVSNYPGKIVRKLRRSIRYPKAAKRKKIRGQVIVSFTVSRNGGVSRIRIARGSGSSILDKAALETVRRSAPFPKIPTNAGKSKWAFRVPLAFK